MKRPPIDWEKGLDLWLNQPDKTAREIAKELKCSIAAVRKRAQRYNWGPRLKTAKLSHVDTQLSHKITIEGKSKTQAAKELGLAKSTVTERTKRPEVAAAISEWNAEMARRCGLESEALLKRRMDIAFCKPSDLFGPDGKPLTPDKIPQKTLDALDVEVRNGEQYTIRTQGRELALKSLEDFMGHTKKDETEDKSVSVVAHIYRAVIQMRHGDGKNTGD